MNTAALLLTLLIAAAPDAVVVCPAVFHEALAPWVEFRQQQGHEVRLVSNLGTPEEIRRRIRQANQRQSLRFVVLVGDAEPAMYSDPRVRDRCVPTHWVKAEVNVLFGSEPHIGTDNWYADLDDDRLPDVAIGRLTADTPQELSAIVEKILAFERSTDFGPWRRRVNMVAGLGGFGAVTDAVIESAARHVLTKRIDPGYQVSLTQANWRSPYCPCPDAFHQATIDRLNEGCRFWVYVGHGTHRELDRVQTPNAAFRILAYEDIGQLNGRIAGPIAVFLACYTGAFDAAEDCLAEQMLRKPGAPVAVIASSRVAMPYAMAVMGTELLAECFPRKTETLGEALLHAKHQMMKTPREAGGDRAMLDMLAAVASPTASKLPQERAEHLSLFNLIGDPLLRCRYPKQVEVDAPSTIAPGTAITMRAVSPVDGRAIIELVVRRDRFATAQKPRTSCPESDQWFDQFDPVYRQANDRRLVWTEATVVGGRLEVELHTPAGASGPCHVRVFIEGADDFALGSADVQIVAPQNEVGTAGS